MYATATMYVKQRDACFPFPTYFVSNIQKVLLHNYPLGPSDSINTVIVPFNHYQYCNIFDSHKTIL